MSVLSKNRGVLGAKMVEDGQRTDREDGHFVLKGRTKVGIWGAFYREGVQSMVFRMSVYFSGTIPPPQELPLFELTPYYI